ncbi:MAG: hypothetical protein J7L15_00620 [Clostridiales bacterium]|nr:hypothetical protein [Clostridiales bacterium]
MKILIIHLGSVTQTLPAISVIKGLLKKAPFAKITWVAESEDSMNLLKFNKDIQRVVSFEELKRMDEIFDILINLHPKFPHNECSKLKIKKAFDFDFDSNFRNFVNVIFGEESIENMNIFQMYYKLSGLTWRGEGYDLNYYPKTRSKRNRVGLGVVNGNLRAYVNDELDIESGKLWHIPYKKNILKRIDEINRCGKVVTDDILTMHIAVSLHKYVYFLETYPMSTKIELFGNGKIYKVPRIVFE